VIAEQYLLRQSLQELGLWEKVGFPKELLTHIIQHFTGDEKGVRELKRAIQTIASKINLLRFYNDKERVPFAVPGFSLPFTVTKEHIELFLKKPETRDASLMMMYN
jgi:ATP-dependent Lon protease